MLLSGLLSPGMTEDISAQDAQSIFIFSAEGLDMDPIYDLLINKRGLRPPIHFTDAHELGLVSSPGSS